MGHELQHAIEILNDPAVRTNEGMFFFLYQSGFFTRDFVETTAAIKVEEAFKAEVKAFSRSSTTKGLSRTPM